MNFNWIVNLFGPVVVFYLVGSSRSNQRRYVAFAKKELPPPAPSHERGKLAIAKRSSLPGSFTTLQSLLKIMVARVFVS